MQFLIDENIRKEIIEFLVLNGHDVKVVPSGSKNGEVIKLAYKEKRTLLTHDIHFSNILLYNPKKLFGIIRIRIHPPNADRIINALDILLKKVKAINISGRLIILEEDNFRIRWYNPIKLILSVDIQRKPYSQSVTIKLSEENFSHGLHGFLL